MMQACPQCGNQNRDTARFCQSCGTTLSEELVCQRCKTANPPSARFCLNCAAPLRGMTPPQTGRLPVNTVLAGRYTVLGKLGRGGMGAVYLVSDARLKGKQWAVKEMSDAVLSAEERSKAVQAFEQEATLLASLNHPNLTKVVDFFAEGGKQYLVMDYIEGQTLQELLAGRSEPFPEEQALDWGGQLCDVLGFLHQRPQSIIFRDLKPSNIMLDRGGRIHLIDFGIVRLFTPGKSRDTMSFGTDGYAPPEQYGRGQTDARSDIYALAVTLHQLLTLRDPAISPFKFRPALELNPKVSKAVSDVLYKGLQHDADARWQSAAEMRQALDRASKMAGGANAGERTMAAATLPSAAPLPSGPAAPRAAPPAAPAARRDSPALIRHITRTVTSAKLAVRRTGFWQYWLVVGILAALWYIFMLNGWIVDELFINNPIFGDFGFPDVFHPGHALLIALVGCFMMLGPLLTHKPGAAVLIFGLSGLAFTWYTGDPLFLMLGALLSAFAIEIPFAMRRYRRFGFQVFWVAILANICVATFFDYLVGRMVDFPLALFTNIAVGSVLGALLATLIGKALGRLS
jgi:serine/threonine-protein kinase